MGKFQLFDLLINKKLGTRLGNSIQWVIFGMKETGKQTSKYNLPIILPNLYGGVG